jgi:hypothetical protein
VVTQPDREQGVSEAFVTLADTLVDDYDIIDLLDQLVGHSVTLLAADAAGILLADLRKQLRPVAVSSEDAETMELLQLQADEGPCLEAYRGAVQVRIPDLTQAAARWPKFVAAVARRGAFASVHGDPAAAARRGHRRAQPVPPRRRRAPRRRPRAGSSVG